MRCDACVEANIIKPALSCLFSDCILVSLSTIYLPPSHLHHHLHPLPVELLDDGDTLDDNLLRDLSKILIGEQELELRARDPLLVLQREGGLNVSDGDGALVFLRPQLDSIEEPVEPGRGGGGAGLTGEVQQ